MVKRANPSKMLMLLLILLPLVQALGGLTPGAYGRPSKAAVRAVAKKPAAHGSSGKAAARPVAARPVARAAKAKVVRESAKSVKARAAGLRRAQAEPVTARGRSRSSRADAELGSGAGRNGRSALRGRALRAEQAREAREEREDARHHGSSRGQAGMKPPATLQAKSGRSEPKPVAVAAKPVMVAAKPVVDSSRPATGQPVVATAVPAAAGKMPAAQTEEPTVRHDRKHHLQAVPVPAASAPGGPVPPDTSKVADSGKAQLAAGVSGSAEASAALFTKGGRRIMPPAMKGSHEILIHQNAMAEQDGLERVQDDEDLMRMRGANMLLPLPENASLATDDRLPANRRFARPWTVKFLEAVAKAHYDRFHTALQVNSAVRTVEFQRNLMRVNGNAAPAEGETASPHLTGQAVDLAKKGLSLSEVAWLRGYLLPLVQQGKIDVEEEFQQSCFHISVYRKYVPEAAPRREIVSRPLSGSAIAAAMR